MLQQQTGFISCTQCNAVYGSEKALREHKKTSHRLGGSEEIPETPGVVGEPGTPTV